MSRTLKITEKHKAEKLLRFVNYFIDLFFLYFVIIVLFGMVGAAYAFVAGDDLMSIANEMENINPLLDRLITMTFYALGMFAIEYFTKGRSLGKLITGTKVVKTDGSPLTANDLLKRNFSRIVPFDAISFVGNNGWHDKWSDTRVVKKNAYESELSAEIDIEQIGVKEEI